MPGTSGSGPCDHDAARSEPPGSAILQTLESILRRSQDPDSLSAHCHLAGMRPADVESYLSNPAYSVPLIRAFMSDQQTYRYQLAVAGSHTPFRSLPADVAERLAIEERDTELDVTVFHSYWELCFRSEAYLARALDLDESLLVVNNADMLAKAKGYKTLLALKNTADSAGTIIAGNWYSPQESARQQVKEAFTDGERTLQLDRGSLVLMRALTDGRESQRVYERAIAYARGGAFGRGKVDTVRHFVRRGL